MPLCKYPYPWNTLFDQLLVVAVKVTQAGGRVTPWKYTALYIISLHANLDNPVSRVLEVIKS